MTAAIASGVGGETLSLTFPPAPLSEKPRPEYKTLPAAHGSFLGLLPMRVESPRNTSMGIILKTPEKRNVRRCHK